MGGTISDLFRRRATRLILSLALLAGVLPFGIATAQSNDASRTPITFTVTTLEVLQEGEGWEDEAGIFHERGYKELFEVAGDINGTGTVALSIDFEPVGECTEDVCPGYGSVWGPVEITDENGGWEGDYLEAFSDVPDDEYFFSQLILRGTGGNAGMSIVAENVGEEGGSLVFEGTLMTMGRPVEGLNLRVQSCFNEDFSTSSNFWSTGAIETAGHAEVEFFAGGSEWTHNYGLAGTATIVDDFGSVTIVFGGNAVDVGSDNSNGWGYFVIVEGTGAYEDLYGHGRTIATAGEMGQCAAGFGTYIHYVGEVTYN